MVKDIQENLQKYTDTMLYEMESDTRHIILGAESYEESGIVRQRVLDLLLEVDRRFQ
jgi:hypothetical protein